MPASNPTPPLPVLRGAGRLFRPSVFRLLAAPFTWVPPLALFALFFGVTALLGRPDVRFAVESGLGSLPISALTSLSLALFPVRVGADGVKGFNFWGVPLLMRWDEIHDARRASLLGFPYLRVLSVRHATALWVPLMLPDLRALTEAVREHAPDSPVARWLADHGY